MDEQLYTQLCYLEEHSDEPECKKAYLDELTKMTKVERAEYVRRRKLDSELSMPYDNRFRGVKTQSNKLVMFEYDNLSRDFDIRTIFLAMENYIFDRYRSMTDLTDVDKTSINKFLGKVFNHAESGHVDKIYDVFVKPHLRERDNMMSSTSSNIQVNPAYIPDAKVAHYDRFADIPDVINDQIIVCNFMPKNDCDGVSNVDAIDGTVEAKSDDDESEQDKYSRLVAPITTDEFNKLAYQERWFIHHKGKLTPMPSYSQLRNAANFHLNKLEEHRMLASIIFHSKPDHELLIHAHGLFDNIDVANQYRIKESKNIHGKVIVVPVGYTGLADDFRCNRDGLVMYNPSDPELELMLNGKHNIRRAEAEAMKARSMSKLKQRADPQTMNMIRNFNRAKERLMTKAEREIRNKYSGNEELNKIKVVENAEAALDKKINDALQFLDENEVVFNTLKVKKGKLVKGEDIVVNLNG